MKNPITIHYQISYDQNHTATSALRKVLALHTKAKSLPFDWVSDIFCFQQEDFTLIKTLFDKEVAQHYPTTLYSPHDINLYYKGHTPPTYWAKAELARVKKQDQFQLQYPQLAFVFQTIPSWGTSLALFGLAQYQEEYYWHLQSSYTTNKNHQALIDLFDEADKLNLDVRVSDPSGYFKYRQKKLLVS